jgi:hypothetical protein
MVTDSLDTRLAAPLLKKEGCKAERKIVSNQCWLGKNRGDKPAIFSKSTQESDEPLL